MTSTDDGRRHPRIWDRNWNLLCEEATAAVMSYRTQPPKVQRAIDRMFDRLTDGMGAKEAGRRFRRETRSKRYVKRLAAGAS